MPDCVFGLAIAQTSSLLGLLAVVEQTFHKWAILVKQAGVARISAV